MKEIFFRSYYRICYQRLMREASSMLIGFLGQRILLRICFIFSGTDLEVAGASPETLVKVETTVIPKKKRTADR